MENQIKGFSLEQIQSSKWLNDDEELLFTARDMADAINFRKEICFGSTGEYYEQVSDYIEATYNIKTEERNERKKSKGTEETSEG